MVSMSIEREFFFTYAAVKNLNYNFSALKDITVSLNDDPSVTSANTVCFCYLLFASTTSCQIINYV